MSTGATSVPTAETGWSGGSVRALLFDLDGTLVETREANWAAYRDAFEASGYTLTRSDFEGTWGQDSRDFIPALLPGITTAGIDRIRADKSRLYGAHLGRTRVNEALVGFLRMVAPTLPTALVSTAKSINGGQILATHDLAELFDVVVWGDEVDRSKPHPDGYLRALAHLGVPAGQCLAFEDSDTGRAAALAAGLLVVEVPRF